MNSRKFIIGLNEKVDFFSDDYLNPHLSTNVEDSSNLADLKSFFLGLFTAGNAKKDKENQHSVLNSQIEYDVVKNFRLNLRIEESNDGVLSVFFKHTSPARSAEILNSALEGAINQIDFEKKEAARIRLNYLEGELKRIQEELEAAVDAMQTYAIEYNIGSINDLASSSLRTDNLRDELKVLIDTRSAIDYLNSLESFKDRYIVDARISFPLIGTLDFRSRLNLPADINAWTKPSDNAFEAARIRVASQMRILAH